MELWVRTGDKQSLWKITNIGYTSFTRTEYCIVTDTNRGEGDYVRLAYYPTKERCIEIINDIYNQITQAVEHGDSVVIYSMPKE